MMIRTKETHRRLINDDSFKENNNILQKALNIGLEEKKEWRDMKGHTKRKKGSQKNVITIYLTEK